MSKNGNDDASTPDDAAEREGISDEQLPEDLQPTDDNPLAQAADVLLVAQRLVEEPRRGDDRRDEHENAVKAIHSRTYELYRQTFGLSMRVPPKAGNRMLRQGTIYRLSQPVAP